MNRHLGLVVLAVLTVVAACESGPTAPGRTPGVSITAQVTANTVACPTCSEPPFIWAVAAAPITVSNPGVTSVNVVTVETQAFNRTRGTLIARNVRPNSDALYLNTIVPARGTLDLEAGVIYHPLPPPGDDIRFIVVVTFDDGRTARAEAPLILTAA